MSMTERIELILLAKLAGLNELLTMVDDAESLRIVMEEQADVAWKLSVVRVRLAATS